MNYSENVMGNTDTNDISIEVSKKTWKAYKKLKNSINDDKKISEYLKDSLSAAAMSAKFDAIKNGAVNIDHYYLIFDSSCFEDLCTLARLKGDQGIQDCLSNRIEYKLSKLNN